MLRPKFCHETAPRLTCKTGQPGSCQKFPFAVAKKWCSLVAMHVDLPIYVPQTGTLNQWHVLWSRLFTNSFMVSLYTYSVFSVWPRFSVADVPHSITSPINHVLELKARPPHTSWRQHFKDVAKSKGNLQPTRMLSGALRVQMCDMYYRVFSILRIVRGMWHWLHSPDLTRLTTCLEEMPVQLAHHPKRQKAQSCWSTSRRHFSWYPRGCKWFMVRKHVAVSIRECTCRMIDRRVDKVGHGGTDSLWLATAVKQTPVLCTTWVWECSRSCVLWYLQYPGH